MCRIEAFWFNQKMAELDRKSQQKRREELETRQSMIALACRDNDYKWPKDLFTGVMLYNGYKITIQEFNNWAKEFLK